MKSSPSISIVVPAYNEEAYIGACMEAVCAQLGQHDEVIVVDNNCTDSTPKILEQIPQVTVLKEIRQGQVHAQATGFQAASGDVLARIDADTIIPEGWIEAVRRHFSASTEPMAITGPGQSYDLVLQRLPNWFMAFWTFRTNRVISGHYPIWGSNCAMSREVWLLVRDRFLYRRDLWEDFELGMIMHRQGLAVIYVPDIVVGYSNRNAINTSPYRAVSYQMRAAKTYWYQQSRVVAVLSVVERILMLVIACPFYFLEAFLQMTLGARARLSGQRPGVD